MASRDPDKPPRGILVLVMVAATLTGLSSLTGVSEGRTLSLVVLVMASLLLLVAGVTLFGGRRK